MMYKTIQVYQKRKLYYDEIKERREMSKRTIVHRETPQGSEDVVVGRASQVIPARKSGRD